MSATRKSVAAMGPDRFIPAEVPPPPKYQDIVNAANPAAYWRMEEPPAGQSFYDSSGYGRTITNTSTMGMGSPGLLITQPGDFCWDAPGNSYAGLGTASWMNTPGFSVEAWVTVDPVGAGNRHIMSRYGNVGQAGWQFKLEGSTNKFMVDHPSVSGYVIVRGETIAAFGPAYHVVYTYDGSISMLYVNGVQDAVSGPLTYSYGASGILIGASYAGTSSPVQFWDGKMDEVAYYGFALTESQVLAHYRAGSGT